MESKGKQIGKIEIRKTRLRARATDMDLTFASPYRPAA